MGSFDFSRMLTETMQISANDDNFSSSSSSTLVLNNIDLLNEILLCLPVKSLVVLKYVSKQWLSLISSPRFMQNHWIRNHKLSGLYFPKDSVPSVTNYDLVNLVDESIVINEGVTFEITQDHELLRLTIEQSCNGLLLCNDYYSGVRYIYNPSTKHYRKIPHNPLCCKGFHYNLVFNPLKSLNYEVISVGNFGDSDDEGGFFLDVYDEGDDDIPNVYQVAIYSSVTKSWRLCRKIHDDLDCTVRKTSVYCDGCLHWVNLRNNTFIYFDTDQEELITLPFSNELQLHKKYCVYFGEWMGHVYLIVSDDGYSYCWDVLEMEINHKGWKPICRANIDELANHYRASGGGTLHKYNFAVVKVVVEGDGEKGDLRAFINLKKDNTLISYDLKKNSFEEICKDNNKFCEYRRWHAYIETLANVV